MTSTIAAELATFGTTVRGLRTERGLSLCKTARLAPCNKGYLCRIEHDKCLPSMTVARALDQVLNADGALVALLGQHLAIRAADRRIKRRKSRAVGSSRTGPAGYRNAAVFLRILGPIGYPCEVAA